MDFKQLLSIVEQTVLLFGGYAIVLTALVGFVAKLVTEHSLKKHDLSLQVKLEKYKSILDNTGYVGRAKFDAEFACYRDICLIAFDTLGYAKMCCVDDNTSNGDAVSSSVLQDKILKFQLALYSYIPILPDNIRECIEMVISKLSEQLIQVKQNENGSDSDDTDFLESSFVDNLKTELIREITMRMQTIKVLGG